MHFYPYSWHRLKQYLKVQLTLSFDRILLSQSTYQISRSFYKIKVCVDLFAITFYLLLLLKSYYIFCMTNVNLLYK